MKNKNNKIPTIFIGTPNFAVPVLESIIKAGFLQLKAVITQPDKEVGRKKILTQPAIKIFIKNNYQLPINNYQLLQPASIKNVEFINQLAQLKPELIIVAAYGQILPKEIIELPKFGCLNIHGSLLPKYRGPSPIQTAILNGESETGVTIMKIDKGLDTGDIISQKKIDIKNDYTSQILSDKLSLLGAELLIKILPDYVNGKIKLTSQNEKEATLTKILDRTDGEINFNKSAVEIERQLRAFTPWPGIYTIFKNKKLKILKLRIEKQINPLMPAGQIYKTEDKLLVNCRSGTLTLEEVQPEGKKIISGKKFLNGYLKN